MTIVDWVIVVVVVLSVIGAARTGLIVEVCSLAGLIAGFVFASWNYRYVGLWLRSWIHSQPLSLALGFIAIVIAVLIVAGILGRVLRWSVHSVGLGWADRIAGAAFGLVKGCVAVTIAVVVVAAFWPNATWLRESEFAPGFLTMAGHVSVVTPSELQEQIRHGVKTLRKEQPDWMRPTV